MTKAWLTVVGVGDDGLAGVSPAGVAAINAAKLVIGHHRLADGDQLPDAEFIPWAGPFEEMISNILSNRGRQTVLLATGDPMHHGIGASLARRLDPEEFLVLPAPSAFSLAAARMKWPLAEVDCISLHYRDPANLLAHVSPGKRLLALTRNERTLGEVAALLDLAGYASARLTVLAHMGGAQESRQSFSVAEAQSAPVPAFYTLAIECGAPVQPDPAHLGAGLPDEAFDHDGQLTKREVRAMTVAALRPWPGMTLWDIGAGSGSVGIEWMRVTGNGQTIAFEQNPARIAMIHQNRRRLGVPDLQVIEGKFPQAEATELPAPDRIFIGGGIGDPAVLQTALAHLRPGGLLVANTVTLEGERALIEAQQQFAGEMTRIDIARSKPVGPLTALEPKMSVLQWQVHKPLHGGLS